MTKLTQENIARLKQLVKDGVSVHQECEDLLGGLNDTVKSISEELEVKPAIIKRLIKDVQKNKMNDRRDDMETLEELYKAAGLG
jgi:type I site-specific restriction-modification system R (restriction) subunit